MIQRRKLNRYSTLLFASILAACNDTPKPASPTAPGGIDNADIPAVMTYDIVKQYPHDPTAFTEGLEYHDGILYESVGEYGTSAIRKVELASGKVLQSVKMETNYFGEGITILNGKIYQLTYREGKCFVYDVQTLKQVASHTFPMQEGWGMTNNGTHLIMDDGGNILYFIDPETFSIVKQLRVTDENGPVKEVNELELIKGYIYANVWKSDMILKIDTLTGKVVARADLSSIREQGGIPPMSYRKGEPDVLNGIAYDAAANRIFVTGKNWPKLFEIKLDN